eukprot:COSAG06_NODE_27761_length_587_cov_0.620902_1_plen_51_part_00
MMCEHEEGLVVVCTKMKTKLLYEAETKRCGDDEEDVNMEESSAPLLLIPV